MKGKALFRTFSGLAFVLVACLAVTGCAEVGESIARELQQTLEPDRAEVRATADRKEQSGAARRVYEGPEGLTLESVRQTEDGGYVATGRMADELYLARFHSNGAPEWERTFGGGEGKSGPDVRQTRDGCHIAVGNQSLGMTDMGNRSNMYIVKTDSNGRLKWEWTHGEEHANSGRSVQGTEDGGSIIAGKRDVHMAELLSLWKVDPQ